MAAAVLARCRTSESLNTQTQTMRQHLTLKAGLCLVGCLQLVAFTSLLFQLPYLYGRDGLQPISRTLHTLSADKGRLPSLLWLHGVLGLTAEALLTVFCMAGWLLSAAAACGFVHPLIFTWLWILYLSVSRLDSFIEYGDEVLLEVTFAAIWLAIAHRAHSNAQRLQQQVQSAQRLKDATCLLVKWLLFRLLLLTGSFSATYLCGQDPVLSSCWKTLLAHGPPHAATRFLMGLPGPLAALAAAIALLELPAAFLVLLYLPALQQATAGALLVLQLLKLAWGTAGLETLAAAVLCVLLLEDGLWSPWVAKLGEVLGRMGLMVQEPGSAADGGAEGGASQHDQGTGMLSRQSSGFSSLGSEATTLGLDAAYELGPTLLERLSWQDLAAAAAFLASVPLLLSFSPKLGLLLRPTPPQLLRVLRVLAPFGAVAWAAAAGVACYRAVTFALSESKAAASEAAEAAAEAKQEAVRAAEEAAAKTQEAETAAQKAEQAAQEAATQAGGAAGASATRAAAADSPAAPVNGVNEAAAAAGAEEGAETGDESEGAPSKGRGRRGSGKAGAAAAAAGASKATSRAAALKAGGAAAAAGGKESAGEAAAGAGGTGGAGPSSSSAKKAAKHRATPSQQQQQLDSPDAPTHTPKSSSRAKPSSKAATAAAAAAAAAGERAKHAREEAEESQHYAAAAQAAAQRHAWRASVGAWVPLVCAGAAALVLLAVLLAGGLQVLAVAGYSPVAVRRVVPGPVVRLMQLGQTWGIASGSSTARSSYLATRRAAAAAGPGAVVLYEAYVSDAAAAAAAGGGGGGSSWRRLPLRYSLGSAQLRGKGDMVQQLLGTRGWFQLRLQGRMAAAAAVGAGGEGAEAAAEEAAEDVEPWLLLLADKLVRGAPELAGLLDGAPTPHDYVTLSRAAYRPGVKGWRLDAQHTSPLLQPREQQGLRGVAQQLEALPGKDGWLVAAVTSLTRRASGPLVLWALLLLVVLRHLLLPGGLVRECQHAALHAAVAAL